MIKTDFHFDWESLSRIDLGTFGSVNYACHPSTDTTRLAYGFGRTGTIKVWRPLTQPVPQEILDVALHPEKYNFIAWNIVFDYLLWICVLPRRVPGLKRPPLENLHDAMALSCHFRTGASIESCSQFMGMPMGKDPEGRRIMLKQCKPGRDGNFPKLTDAEEIAFDRYAIGDVRIMRDAYYRMPPLPEPERYAWSWTFRRNIEGIKVDIPLVLELKSIVDESMPKLEKEFESIVGCSVRSPKAKDWFKQFWPWIEDMQKDTVRDMFLDPKPVPPHAKRALELKDLAGSTSISKLQTAIDHAYLGRIYDVLKYHFAQTKRWSGHGIQIQNQPRVDTKRPDNFFNPKKDGYIKLEIDHDDLASQVKAIRHNLRDPIGFAKNLIRRMWIPANGRKFFCGDWSKIEPTTLFWLVGLGPIPKKWYEEMAAEIYSKPVEQISKDSEERQVGKTAALSCGYGAGWKSFIEKTYADTGIVLTEEMSKQVINAYRRKYPHVVQMWKDLESGFRLAIHGQTSSVCGGKVHIMPMQMITPMFKGVAIRLPSGSYLFYHQAKEGIMNYMEEVTEYRNGVPVTFKVPRQKSALMYLSDAGKGRLEWKTVYRGLLCENVTSATARDIILPSTFNMERRGVNILGLVHDEMWGEHHDLTEDEFKRLMCINPSWCPDMDIQAECNVGVRYLK